MKKHHDFYKSVPLENGRRLHVFLEADEDEGAFYVRFSVMFPEGRYGISVKFDARADDKGALELAREYFHALCAEKAAGAMEVINEARAARIAKEEAESDN